MWKAWFFAAALVMGAHVLAQSPIVMAAGNEDVFQDEGDGDFDMMPIPPSDEQPSRADAPPANESPASISADYVDYSDDDQAPEAESKVAPAKKSAKAHKAQKAHNVEKAHKAQAAPKAAKKTAKVSKKSPSGKLAQGSFLTTRGECPMQRSPASDGETMITVRAEKRIWVEEVDGSWVKGYNKAGEPGFLNRECFN